MGYLLLFLLGGTIWLLAGGIGELKLALENPEPRTMTIDQFNKAPQESGWFRITDCTIDLREAMYTESAGGSMDELYLPVGSPGAETTSLLLKTDDPQLLSKLTTLRSSVDSLQTDEQTVAFLVEHADELVLAEPVQGMTEYGLDEMDSDLRGQIQGMSSLADRFVVLTDGDHPNLVSGLVKTILGLLVPIGAIVLYRRSRDDEKPASRSETPGEPPVSDDVTAADMPPRDRV